MNPQSAPTNYRELREQLQERMPKLAQGQQRVATLLLTDPEGTAFRTIAETAALANVHQSSLVRFATGFGIKGYPGLVKLCRDYLSDQAHLVRRFDQVAGNSSTEGLLASVLEHEQQNLSRTFARIPSEQWDKAVGLLAQSPAVYVMGLRKCLPVAQLLTYLLHLVRPRVHQVAPVVGSLADQLRDFQRGDVFVAVSIRRYTSDTVYAFEEAKRRNLSTIVLTDNAASPLAKDADVVFFVDSQGVHILRSISAFISMAQTLATSVAQKLGTESRSELLVDEALLTSLQVYADGDADGD
ncbi:MurR/RpiR family transcriptional regulator [Arthrobacter sp. UYEF3]|uniref:MurR/RpiR family transcriptional regulator n=1 Tax=Arthrobacter sp. UYEF3 TaxID=1756365 RepID=UPI003394AC59